MSSHRSLQGFLIKNHQVFPGDTNSSTTEDKDILSEKSKKYMRPEGLFTQGPQIVPYIAIMLPLR